MHLLKMDLPKAALDFSILSGKAGVLAFFLTIAGCHQHPAPPHALSSFASLEFKTDYEPYLRLIPSPDQPQVVYYVPTDGGLLSENGRPRLNVRQSGGVLRFSGAFKTGGYEKVLASLRSELKEQGFVLAPAPIRKARADYLLSAKFLPSGRYDIKCGEDPGIRSCLIWDERTGSYTLASTDIRRFQASFPSSGTVADRMFFNFEVNAESYRDQIQDFLNSGLEWDSFFIGKVDWLLNIQKPIGELKLSIDWQELAARSREVIRQCQGSCEDSELQSWFRDLTESGQKGVTLREGDLRNIGLVFHYEIRPRLFVELTDPQLLNQGGQRFYTLRLEDGLEQSGTQDLIWNLPAQDNIPGSQESYYRIECLKGAIDQPLTWAPASAFCPT